MDVAPPTHHVTSSVAVDGLRSVSDVRRVAKQLAEVLHFGAPDLDRVETLVTAAATHVIQDAERGEILLRAIELDASLELLALDRGPGIANIAQAMLGGELGTIARLSTRFELSSVVGTGTALWSRIARTGPTTSVEPGLEWGVVCVPKRDEVACGDAWAVSTGPARSAVLVVDGLGHGPGAYDAARKALDAFGDHADQRPEAILGALDRALRDGRGAVAAITEIDWTTREVRHAGAGNIAGTLLSGDGRGAGMVSHNGTLGHAAPQLQEFRYAWPDQGLLILHSDGLSSRWDLEPYPGLTRKHPSLIAGVLYRDFANRRDDVIVLVARERARAPDARGGDVA